MFGRSAQVERAAPNAHPPAAHQANGPEVSPGQHSPADPAAGAHVARVGFLWNPDGMSDPLAAFMGTGAQVAASSLAPALLRHSGFEAIDVFVRQSAVEATQGRLRRVSIACSENSRKLRFVPESQLPVLLQSPGYDVLHDTGTDLMRLSAIRAHLTHRVFPITCSQHGISYSFQLHTQYIPMLRHKPTLATRSSASPPRPAGPSSFASWTSQRGLRGRAAGCRCAYRGWN